MRELSIYKRISDNIYNYTLHLKNLKDSKQLFFVIV